jgi:hypothetical protein
MEMKMAAIGAKIIWTYLGLVIAILTVRYLASLWKVRLFISRIKFAIYDLFTGYSKKIGD